VLVIGRRAGGESYGFEDMELLGTIAGQATIGIRNAAMHAQEVEQERIARELSVAREIQRQLLPAELPSLSTMEFAGGTSPCHEVGGDFYDYLPLEGTRVGLAVGDVSGHGVPAALMMASLSGTLRSEAMRERDPGRLLHRLNARACETMEPGHFLSLFYGIIDPDSRTIAYANAGHPPPLIVEPGGKVIQLTTGGLLLGVDARARYRSDEATLSPGSIVVLFSDGLVEGHRDELEFGEERIIELVRRNGTGRADEIHHRIVESARAFVDGELQDDVTLIVIRVGSGPAVPATMPEAAET
jgi:sigma-B regulation protein RsbU (phosphoserine phosphatase)